MQPTEYALTSDDRIVCRRVKCTKSDEYMWMILALGGGIKMYWWDCWNLRGPKIFESPEAAEEHWKSKGAPLPDGFAT